MIISCCVSPNCRSVYRQVVPGGSNIRKVTEQFGFKTKNMSFKNTVILAL